MNKLKEYIFEYYQREFSEENYPGEKEEFKYEKAYMNESLFVPISNSSQYLYWYVGTFRSLLVKIFIFVIYEKILRKDVFKKVRRAGKFSIYTPSI